MEFLVARLVDPFVSLVDPSHRIYWLYLASSLVIAGIVYFATCASDERSLRRLLSYCFPLAILSHKSARIDYVFFIVNRIAFGVLLLPAITLLGVLAGVGTETLLSAAIPGGPFWSGSRTSALVAQTVVTVLAMDFALFLAHYLQHRVPLLWEFHKVHHSAQVLTPITAYRMHPVDDVLSVSFSGIAAGIVQGLFGFLDWGGTTSLTLLGINAGLFLFYATGYNLRHSHVWLSYGPILSRVFISPAQHQIHHSREQRHFDKNFGFIFAFWDDWFGSLYVPKHRESFELGLAAREDEQYQSLRALYLVPFQRSRLAAGTSSLAVVLVIGLLATLSIQSVSLIGVALAVDRGKQVEATDRSSAVAPLAFSAAPSVHLEDLTWPEVQGLLAGGTHVVIVPTGGIEQNGLHMILGKHNYIVREAGEAIAKKLGNALVAPVISYVPQGDIDPPSGHMKFPGTLSVSDRVFEAVLEQTARSLKRHGFRMICFVGDSGGNQEGQQRVAERLTKLWRDDGVRVVHVGDYYFANGQLEWLEARGESVKAIGTHAGIRDTSELLFVRPQGVRTDSIRQSVERSSQTGTIGDPSRATKEYGEALLAKKVDAAVQQILPFVSDLRKAAQVESGRLRLPTNQNW